MKVIKNIEYFVQDAHEMIRGRWAEAELTELKLKIIEAKKLRCKANKAQRCGPCLS